MGNLRLILLSQNGQAIKSMINTEDFRSYLLVKKGLAKRTVQESLIKTRTIEEWLSSTGNGYSPCGVEKFMLWCQEKNLKSSTINNYLTNLKRIEEYFNDRGVPHEDFLKNLDYLKTERAYIDVLSPDEIKRILETNVTYAERYMGIDTSFLNEQYKLFTMFLAFTGCRFSEASLLKVKYFDQAGSVTFVETKTRQTRKVPITEPLLSKLIEQVKLKCYEDYVFANCHGKPIVDVHFLFDLKKRAVKAGIKKRVYPHLFRHSFITSMISSGVPIITVASIVGHQDINTTAYYTHLADDTLLKALYRHPLIKEKTPPSEILKTILEAVKSYKLEDDYRFKFRILETGNSLKLDISF